MAAKYAAAGWAHFAEGVDFYGPNERARLEAQIAQLETEVRVAEAELNMARAKLSALP